MPCRIGDSTVEALNANPIEPWVAVTIWFASFRFRIAERAFMRAAVWALGVPVTVSPLNPNEPPVGSDSDRTVTPLPNTCAPENDIDIGGAPAVFMLLTTSPSRPAHPVGAVSVAALIVVMFSVCWSLCENSWDGTGMPPCFDAVYCARVIGAVSEPLFAMIAALP